MLYKWGFLVIHSEAFKRRKKICKSPGCKHAFLTEEVTNSQQYLHIFMEDMHVVDPREAVAARGLIKYTWKSMVSCLY